MLTQRAFDFGLHGMPIEEPQSAGQWIRSLREERQIKGSDVERISRNIAKEKGNRNFYIPHGTLADIENGSIPSIHKLFSLAICLRVSLHDLLFAFGIYDQEINQAIAEAPPVETQRETKREDEQRDTDDGETHREYMRKWRAAQVYEPVADSYQPTEMPQIHRADKHERMAKLVNDLRAKAAIGAAAGR